MPLPAPTAQEQLDFRGKIDRILSQGQFTTTYKFVLLLRQAVAAMNRPRQFA